MNFLHFILYHGYCYEEFSVLMPAAIFHHCFMRQNFHPYPSCYSVNLDSIILTELWFSRKFWFPQPIRETNYHVQCELNFQEKRSLIRPIMRFWILSCRRSKATIITFPQMICLLAYLYNIIKKSSDSNTFLTMIYRYFFQQELLKWYKNPFQKQFFGRTTTVRMLKGKKSSHILNISPSTHLYDVIHEHSDALTNIRNYNGFTRTLTLTTRKL